MVVSGAGEAPVDGVSPPAAPVDAPVEPAPPAAAVAAASGFGVGVGVDLGLEGVLARAEHLAAAAAVAVGGLGHDRILGQHGVLVGLHGHGRSLGRRGRRVLGEEHRHGDGRGDQEDGHRPQPAPHQEAPGVVDHAHRVDSRDRCGRGGCGGAGRRRRGATGSRSAGRARGGRAGGQALRGRQQVAVRGHVGREVREARLGVGRDRDAVEQQQPTGDVEPAVADRDELVESC